MIISESLFRLQAEEKLDLRRVKIMESSVTITIEKNPSVPFMTFRLKIGKGVNLQTEKYTRW